MDRYGTVYNLTNISVLIPRPLHIAMACQMVAQGWLKPTHRLSTSTLQIAAPIFLCTILLDMMDAKVSLDKL
jgi:hypothetical protein